MTHYAKVFASMFTGSMYGAGTHIFATWAWVLTHKDAEGLVEINTKLVAAELGAEVEQIDEAIAFLTAPDPESRTPDEQGRRLIRVGQFAYQVVNNTKYRNQGADRTEYWRQYRRRKQAERNSCATVAQPCAQLRATQRTQAKAKAKAQAQEKRAHTFTPPSAEEVRAYAECKGFPDFDADKFIAFYSEADWHDSRGNPVRNWRQKMLSTWLRPDNGKRRREPVRGDFDYEWSETEVDEVLGQMEAEQ